LKTSPELKRIFCVGPLGCLMTLILWLGTGALEKIISFPKMNINPTFRTILMVILAIDALYLLFGGVLSLPIKERGKTLVTTGPYKYIRHPLYSAFIYSMTGLLALWFESWFLLFSVVVLALIWSLLVQKEEQYMLDKFGKTYRDYIEKTGQFLPSWKALKKETENTRR
jgi:protein-S-isoprenylcysteine O-methyltransferase Ste14